MRNYRFSSELNNLDSEYQSLRKRGVDSLQVLYEFYRDDASSIIKIIPSESISEELFFEYFQFDLKFRTQIEFKQISSSTFKEGFITTYLIESVANELLAKRIICEMEFDRYGNIDNQYSSEDFYVFYLKKFIGQLMDYFRKCERWEPFKKQVN
jgi:hypothetical protein